MAGRAGQLLDQSGTTLRDSRPEVPGQSKTVRVELLDPNGWNPNEQDDETFLKEKTSIRRFGFVVPIIVRPSGKRFEIIDGEHRWRAAIELGLTEIPVHDIGPIPDYEAEQLTIILNELRGKPNEKKLATSLKRLLASDTLDRLTEVLPYSKEQFGKIAKLPEFDWGKLQKANQERSERRWVERIFRLPKETAEILDEAIKKAKADRDDIDDVTALEAIAKEFLDDGLVG